MYSYLYSYYIPIFSCFFFVLNHSNNGNSWLSVAWRRNSSSQNNRWPSIKNWRTLWPSFWFHWLAARNFFLPVAASRQIWILQMTVIWCQPPFFLPPPPPPPTLPWPLSLRNRKVPGHLYLHLLLDNACVRVHAKIC